MRDRRITQQIATGGMVAGNPSAIATGGLVPSRNRFRVVGVDKAQAADGTLDYRGVFESQVAARSAEIVVGEYVDDLAVTGGTAT